MQPKFVTYHCTKEEQKVLNNNLPTCPAIVTAEWGDSPGSAKNLRIFFDSPTVGSKTSVTGHQSEYGSYYSE